MEFHTFIAGAAVLVAAPLVAAQNAAAIKLPVYSSAFEAYLPYRDEKLANWRDVNDTIGALGGHSAHLREVAKTVTGDGTVLEIDLVTSRVRIESDGVKALGWPPGVVYWPLKAPWLADQVKAGERVAFTLEQDGDIYRVVGFGRSASSAPIKAK
ncbi:unnamed protein product, partial [Phaeothamnion confervicola]